MSTPMGYLADTSAYWRLAKNKQVHAEWREAFDQSEAGVCDATALEVSYSARSVDELAGLRDHLWGMFHRVRIPKMAGKRALEVQAEMSRRGTHRSADPIDLLVAATAEILGLTLVHYDSDFECVAEVTGQPHRWVAERGSVA